MELVSVPQLNSTFGEILQEIDPIMELTKQIGNQAALNDIILTDIRSNAEKLLANFSKKEATERIIRNFEELGSSLQAVPEYVTQSKETLHVLQEYFGSNVKSLQISLQRFQLIIGENASNLAKLQTHIVNEKILVWKHEQQKLASGINRGQCHSVDLSQIQIWCEELAKLFWRHYHQLIDVERILKNETINKTGNLRDFGFIQSKREEVTKLLGDFLNQTLIVEAQPPQIINSRAKFTSDVVVSLLIGTALNIHIEKPALMASLINESQARKYFMEGDEVNILTGITNGKAPMESKGERLSASFRNLKLANFLRAEKGNYTNERVMEEKLCLYFSCHAKVGEDLKFKVSTISLPVVVISHGSQEALAMATISWDYAFAEIKRVPFKVPSVARWADVEQILNKKFEELTGRGLTSANLQCLAQKVFGDRHPHPETITWEELCKKPLLYRSFTFWEWYHAALKLIKKKETNLIEIWNANLIEGFIERVAGEQIISLCQPGTFLLRFSDTIPGAITITVKKSGTVVSLDPYRQQLLECKKLAMEIKRIPDLEWLYHLPHCVSKGDAFGRFYDKETPETEGASDPNKKPYVPLIPTVPDVSENQLIYSSYDKYLALPSLSIQPTQDTPANPVVMPTHESTRSPASSLIYSWSVDSPLPISTSPFVDLDLHGELSTPQPLLEPSQHHFQFLNQDFEEVQATTANVTNSTDISEEMETESNVE